jgi:hypothetical protein
MKSPSTKHQATIIYSVFPYTNMMMKQTIAILFLLASPAIQVAFACKCMQPTASNALNSTTASIFTGTVLSQKKPLDKEVQEIVSIVSIDRVIKGCSVKKTDRIVVKTASSSAACGVYFVVGESYFFTGDIEKLDTDLLFMTYGLKFKKPIKSTVHASSCSFTILKRDVTTKDRNILFEYGKNKNICPVKCIVGTDCPNQDYYCDSGTCKLFMQKCPPDRPPTPCFADPCTVTTPCRDDLQCTQDYCGTCTAIFTDANRTRTCIP